MAHLRVLFTADLHGRLSEAQGARLARLKAERRALLLDGGDAVSAGNVFCWPWPEAVLARMSRAGYDALGAGNREFFFRRSGLRAKLRGAGFAVVASNLFTREGQPALAAAAQLETREGERLGVVGVMPEMIPPGTWAERCSDLRFRPWREVLPALLGEWRPRVDWLVALSHLPAAATRELAAACPELDLVLAGHAHPEATSVAEVGRTTVVTVPPYLREVAMVESRESSRGGGFMVEVIPL